MLQDGLETLPLLSLPPSDKSGYSNPVSISSSTSQSAHMQSFAEATELMEVRKRDRCKLHFPLGPQTALCRCVRAEQRRDEHAAFTSCMAACLLFTGSSLHCPLCVQQQLLSSVLTVFPKFICWCCAQAGQKTLIFHRF